MPDPFDPQSLNRYSYCLNNPLKYVDPTGHCSAEPAKKSSGWHGILDGLGMIPGVGEIFDGINGLIYTLEGNSLYAGLSFATMIPVAGMVATGGKAVLNGARWAGKAIGKGIAKGGALLGKGVKWAGRGIAKGVKKVAQ